MEQGLARSMHWLQALLVIFGAFFIVIFSAGSALAEIGIWSIAVWAAVVVVGLLQAYVLLRLAQRYPNKAGGTATYALELFGGHQRIIAFLSGWGYWIAWTPTTALNSYLCASLLNQVLGVGLHPILLTLLVMAGLYLLNYFGLSKVLFSTYVLAIMVSVPLIILLYLALQVVTPATLARTLTVSDAPSWSVFLKWFFVIAWTGYAVEIISSLIAETRTTHRHTSRLFTIAAGWSVLAFVGIPILLALLTNWQTLAQNPFESLQPLFLRYLGPTGSVLLSLFLIGSLLYSALAFLLPPTRTLYQMAHDGLIPSYFTSLNRYGSPQRSLALDLGLNVVLLLIFQHSLIAMLAVANVGYLLVFVILPFAYLRFLQCETRHVGWLDWLIAASLFAINTIVLLIGGIAWGWFVFGIGWLLVLLGIPLYLAAQRYQTYIQRSLA
jgi:amino acid transporter